MSDTTTTSPIKASYVAWTFDLMNEWGATGNEFFVFRDGDHIIASNRFTAYRLAKSEFDYLSQFMAGRAVATFEASPYGVTSYGAELDATTHSILIDLMTRSDQDEECTLLPIGFSEIFAEVDAHTTFCASASGRVEIIQTQMVGPLENIAGTTFLFAATDRAIRVVQGDLCIALIMAIAESDTSRSKRSTIDRIARAAYEIVQSEVRS